MAYNGSLEITMYSHFFEVRHNADSYTIKLLLDFNRRYLHIPSAKARSRGGDNRSARLYASRYKDYSAFRYHVGQFEELKRYLETKGLVIRYTNISKVSAQPGIYADIQLNSDLKLRPEQQEAVDFILTKTDTTDDHSRLVTMPTGTGKGIVSLAAISSIKKRTMVLILPLYMEKWEAEIKEKTNVAPDRIVCIQGAKRLSSFIDNVINHEEDFDICILSITTLRSQINKYIEANGDYKSVGLPITPEEICEKLGIGVVIIDEAHQHMHGVYTSIIHFNVPLVIALSATYTADDIFIRNMQNIMFPKQIRFDKVTMEKYIRVLAISYDIPKIKKQKIKTSFRYSNTYSHAAYEASIMSNKETLDNYLSLINDTITEGYFRDYIAGDKLAIYVATISLATEVVKYLKDKYPSSDIRRYVDNDPYENAIEPDIRVTTITSMGTAIDIPNLRVVIMTQSIRSSVANLQVLGRLRKLKDRDVKFIYLYCNSIPKQVQYHRNRLQLFRGRVASIWEGKSSRYV